MIPYGRQDISEADIAAVVAVLRSDWLTQGPAIETFEQGVANYCGAKYAVAVSNATAALHIACMAAGLGAGDAAWTSPNTFVASANCALYCGAQADFVDIDPQTYNMSVDLLEQKLIAAARNGTLPKVVIPVHFAGHCCDMERIAALAQRFGFTVIEDASHAIGGRYRDRPVGAGVFSDMTVLSFHPVKIITTGEGGMVLTNRADLYQKLIRLRSHGITRDPALMAEFADAADAADAAGAAGADNGPWSYQQLDLGFNYRMTDLQAALGSSQMQRLETFIARRRQLAQRYDELLSDLPLQLPAREPGVLSAFHLYAVQLRPQQPSHDRRQVFEALRARGIGVNVHYIPVHTQPYYRRLGFAAGDFPQAERYYRHAISLPLYYGLTEAEQDQVVQALREVLA